MELFNELQSNRRLRMGLAMIMAIFVIYGLLEWRDHHEVRITQFGELSSQAARLGTQQNQALWPARAEAAKTALGSARQRVWRNTSIGLAQAQFQDWIYGVLRQVDAKSFTVKLSEGDIGFGAATPADRSAQGAAGLKQLRARIEFNRDIPVMLALLAAMNDAEHQVIVETFNVKPTRVELGVTVWYDLNAAQTTAQDSRPLAAKPPSSP